MTTLNASFLKANPNHDSRGRFASADAAGAAAGEHGAEVIASALPPGTDEPTRRSARDIARQALGAMHDAAANLAAKARHVVGGMRITGLFPTSSGGIEIHTAHDLPSDAGHITARLQLHPTDVRDPNAKRAVSVAHAGLLALGKRIVPQTHGNDLRFKNGPAPRPSLHSVLAAETRRAQ